MTLICFINQKDKLYLASDSLASTTSISYDNFGDKAFKKPFVFYDESKKENEKYSEPHCFVIAGAGDAGVLTSIRYGFQLPAWNIIDSFETYVSASLIPSLRTYLLDLGYLKTIEGRQDMESEFYIIYNNQVIKIQRGISPFISGDPYGAIGSGGLIGMGVLYSTKNWKDPMKRIKRVMDAGKGLDPSVGGRINIVTLTEKDYKGD